MTLSNAALSDLAGDLEEVAEHLDPDVNPNALALVTACRERVARLLNGEAADLLTRAIVDHVAVSDTRCSCNAIYATADEYAPQIAFAAHQAAAATSTLY